MKKENNIGGKNERKFIIERGRKERIKGRKKGGRKITKRRRRRKKGGKYWRKERRKK